MHTAPHTQRRTLFLGGALLTQLVFQGESLVSAWFPSRVYEPVPLQGLYPGKPQQIERTMNPTTDADPHRQGEFITPVRAVVNCYDMDDFTRAPVGVGTQLIKDIRAAADSSPLSLQAGFVTWNRIRIESQGPKSAPPGTPGTPAAPTVDPPNTRGGDSLLQITLNQAYHAGWSSPDCALTRGDRDTLRVSCPNRVLQEKPVDLVFFDPVSALGMRVSVRAATTLGGAAFALGLLSLVPRRRAVARPAA